jgi:nitroreductase
MQFDDLDVESVDYVLSTTRSVRRRLDLERPVPREVITECLQLALQAPTGSNTQNWRFLVITEADTRARIGDIYRRLENGMFAENAKRYAESNPQTSRVYESAGHLKDILGDVPVHVIACVPRPANLTVNVIAASMYGSITPAVWSFMLALRSRGLGSVWTTLHLMAEQEVADLLGIPDKYMQVALVPVAYTKGLEFRPAERLPLDAVTHWERWVD